MSSSEHLSEDEFTDLGELLAEAESCAALSTWEERFLDGVRERVLLYNERLLLSDKQRALLAMIREKVRR